MPYKIVQNGDKFSLRDEKAIEKLMLTGGDGWDIEFGTADCQDGWAVLKSGTGQSIGCYKTKAEAEEALSGLDSGKIDILSDEVRTSKTPEEFAEDNKVQINKSATSIWDGVFVPSDKGFYDPGFNSYEQDSTYYFPSKASYENDGKPSVGYGNRSSNDSIPEGGATNTDRTTRPGNRTWQ